jgi:hypothetical protein
MPFDRIGSGRRPTSSGRSTSAGRPPFSPHLARPRRPPIQCRAGAPLVHHDPRRGANAMGPEGGRVSLKELFTN